MAVRFMWGEDEKISQAAIIAKYAACSAWLDANCRGQWWRAPQGVTHHFELPEDAVLYQMFWGGYRLDHWCSRERLLRGDEP